MGRQKNLFNHKTFSAQAPARTDKGRTTTIGRATALTDGQRTDDDDGTDGRTDDDDGWTDMVGRTDDLFANYCT